MTWDYLVSFSRLFPPTPLPRLESPLRCGTCVLGAALGTRSRRHGLPIKAFKGGKSNRCILRTVQSRHLHTPAPHSLLFPLQKGEALPSHTQRLLLRRRGEQ